MIMAEESKTKTAEKPGVKKGKIAIIRLRGLTGLTSPVKDTLSMLNLHKKHHCVVVDSSPVVLGMIRKVKDYITWGYIDSETLKVLTEKKGEKSEDGKL